MESAAYSPVSFLPSSRLSKRLNESHQSSHIFAMTPYRKQGVRLVWHQGVSPFARWVFLAYVVETVVVI